MHNKFIICYNNFGFNYDTDALEIDGEILTGSYNYTENSNNSFENIVCIKKQNIIISYFQQFAELATLSVPLNWKSEWKPHEGEIRYGS